MKQLTLLMLNQVENDIVTITSSGVTIASDAGTDFTTEFTGQIDTSKTKLII